jgi:hypothetical protein
MKYGGVWRTWPPNQPLLDRAVQGGRLIGGGQLDRHRPLGVTGVDSELPRVQVSTRDDVHVLGHVEQQVAASPGSRMLPILKFPSGMGLAALLLSLVAS